MSEPNDAARLLYDRFSLDYLQGLIGREFESNTLECKEKAHPESVDLDDSDISNFAKALSGFANTGGGVLLWGVQARKVDDIDRIQQLVPISDIVKFEAKLRDRESSLVEYVVPGVEYKSIVDRNGGGFLAVLIPQSPMVPHRVNRKSDHHFYIRAGGTFSPLPLTIVEDLFSRRASPALEVFLKQTTGGSVHIFRLCVRNTGKATARFPFIVISLPIVLAPSGYELDGNSRLTSWISTRQYKGKDGRFLLWNDGNRYAIHPDQELEVLELTTMHAPASVSGIFTFTVEYFVYAEGMSPRKGICEITG
jgi:hypothetical protein